MQSIRTTSGVVNSFCDAGSTCCLILFSTTRRLGLVGEDVVLTLDTVTGSELLQTKLYSLNLVALNGSQHTIKVFGVQKICGDMGKIDLNGVRGLFSPDVQESWDKVESRPVGQVELLIGANQIGLHPVCLLYTSPSPRDS